MHHGGGHAPGYPTQAYHTGPAAPPVGFQQGYSPVPPGGPGYPPPPQPAYAMPGQAYPQGQAGQGNGN